MSNRYWGQCGSFSNTVWNRGLSKGETQRSRMLRKKFGSNSMLIAIIDIKREENLMNIRKDRTSDRPAAVALIATLVIFIPVLARGWQNLFSSQGFYVSIFLGFVIAFVAVAFAWAIANERVRRPGEKIASIAYFFFLFNISALGTINAAFITFQASNVFREEIDKAIGSVVKLRDIGEKNLETAEYDRFNRDVMDAWGNFRAELENPTLCGQGAYASQRAEELRRRLPGFRLLAWRGKCEDVPGMVDAYESQINGLIANSREYAAQKGIIDFKSRLAIESESMLKDLRLLSKESAIGPDIRASKLALYEVSEKHSQLEQELQSRIGLGKIEIPKIDVSIISALGDIGQILPFIMARMANPSTYIYLFFAICLDLAVIIAFANVMRGGERSRRFPTKPKEPAPLY